MKIILLILLSTCALIATAEYPRFKRRGSPQPPRPPPMPPYVKQRPQPPNFPVNRQQTRQRPIPVHMPMAHKIPMGIPPQKQRPISPPVRNFWKNAQAGVKFPSMEKPYVVEKPFSNEKPLSYKQEKPFMSSPAVNLFKDYDYHIQSNSIPVIPNPIKQVGEKGPIHTIPAPNLSLADKPIVAEGSRKQHGVKYHTSPYLKAEQTVHQYQVTESTEPVSKIKTYRPTQPQQNLQQQIQVQQLTQQEYQELQKQQQLFQQEYQKQLANAQQQHQIQQEQLQQQYFVADNTAAPQTQVPQSHINKEVYQVVNTYPHQTQQLHTQAIQTSFYQQQPQIPSYQTLLTQQLYQNEPTYVQNNEPPTSAADKSINIEPEYQSFNYDEQAHQKSHGTAKNNSPGLVTAGYVLDSESEASEAVVEGISNRNSAETLNQQSQIIQNYFDNRSDDSENHVEPDARPSSSEKPQDRVKHQILTNSRYSSLPNKEIADRLAQLQAAGKVNSHLMQIPSQKILESKNAMKIYIPDEDRDHRQDNDSKEYEDYSQEDEDSGFVENTDFGHKIQTQSQ